MDINTQNLNYVSSIIENTEEIEISSIDDSLHGENEMVDAGGCFGTFGTVGTMGGCFGSFGTYGCG